jgi:hypothetical protein
MKSIITGLGILFCVACTSGKSTLSSSNASENNGSSDKRETTAPEQNPHGINAKTLSPPQSISSPPVNQNTKNGERPK